MPLRRPLQVWLPTRGVSLVREAPADVLYAYCAWGGDQVVRFRPRLRREVRRGRFPFSALFLPAHAGPMDVEVFHVGRNDRVWGPRSRYRFPKSRVHGLLDQWLGLDLRPFSPSGPVQPWPAPLARLLPREGAGGDECRVQQEMVEVGKLSQKNLAQALRAATDLAVPYLTEGYSFYLHADLGPTWEERGREPTWFQLASAGRVPRNRALQEVLQGKNPQIMDPKLREELKADPWRTGLSDLVPVRRCWGVQGLFWALLIDRLEGERGFTTCLRCQRILPGPRERCGSRDDRTCHKAQAAERQRRARRRR